MADIEINESEIRTQLTRMAALRSSVVNRKLTVNFAESKGAVAEQTLKTAEELNQLGQALASLYHVTGFAISRAYSAVSGVDSRGAAAVRRK